MVEKTTAFFAYPGSNPSVRDAITGAAEEGDIKNLNIKLWEKMNILGFKLDELIREEINNADVLLADITYPNHNVLYEIGYAIASGKPVLPTVNVAIAETHRSIDRLGLFDTTGYAGYNNNSRELVEKIVNWKAES